MATGHTHEEKIKDGEEQSLSASESDVVISEEFWFSPQDSLAVRFDMNVTAVSGPVTVTLQDSFDGSSWYAKKTVDVSGTGTASLKLLSDVDGDQTYLPLRPRGRLKADTDGGESITIDSIYKSKRS